MWRNHELWMRKCWTSTQVEAALQDGRSALKDKNLSRVRQGLQWFTLTREPRVTKVANANGTHWMVTARILIGERETNIQRAKRFVRNLKPTVWTNLATTR